MNKYMVVANLKSNENNNLEIIDFDLSKEEALEKLKKLQNTYADDELESVCICEHGNFIYN